MDRAIAILLVLVAAPLAVGGVILVVASPFAGMGGGSGQAVVAATGLGAIAGAGGVVAMAIGVWRGSRLAWWASLAVALLMLLGGLVLVIGSLPLPGLALVFSGVVILAAAIWRIRRGWAR